MATVSQAGSGVEAMARREYGTGSVYQRKSDGMYVAALPLPPGPDGRPGRKTKAATPSTLVGDPVDVSVSEPELAYLPYGSSFQNTWRSPTAEL